MTARLRFVCVSVLVVSAVIGAGGCLRELYPDFLVSSGTFGSATSDGAGVFSGGGFTEDVLQTRTFTGGTSVNTATYAIGDVSRLQLAVDFNADGKVDPVVGYGDDQAIVQILLSQGEPGTVEFLSLTLDNNRDMQQLADVAVGDIDNDGALDIIAGAEGVVWYLRHPNGKAATELRDWSITKIDSSEATLSEDELTALITQALGIAVNLDDYVVRVEQTYSNVEIGDIDDDGDNDVVASRTFRVDLEPRPDAPVDPIQIVDGNLFVLENPGFAADGTGWISTSIGVHERLPGLDRDGASSVILNDLNGDGLLDVVSAARDDNNVQVAWFENPGGFLETANTWTQWRIGSVRNALSIDVGDVTGDGLVDVVAVGGEQQQIILFEQPATGPARSYDWDTFPIITFESYDPRDAKILDLDNDGINEIVVGGTQGAVRYFARPDDYRDTWQGFIVTTFDPAADIGLLGYGDLDGDGDLDLIAVGAGEEDNGSRLSWIRNDQ